ncbi:MAG: thioredoxin domain-containing protein, partial [Candidatus Nitrosotenuis sp.]
FEGHTILNNSISASTVAFHFGMAEDQVHKILVDGSKKLLDVRSKRIRPGLDDKILTSWNALMISAFAKGYRVTDERDYLEAAEKCVSFVEKNLISGTQLLRTYKNGKAKLNAYLEDYAYFINSLIDVFEITAEPRYMSLATHLGNHLIDHFWDEKTNSFYFTADDHEHLIIRPKNNYDLSMPSGNSVAANCMLKLYHLTQQNRFLEIATKTMESFALAAAENPFGFGYLLNVIYLYLQKPTEITILNPTNREIHDFLTKKFLPEVILVTISDAEKLKELSKYSFFAGKEFTADRTTVFVCKNFACSLPLHETSDIEQLLS